MSVSVGQAPSMLEDLRARIDGLATRLALQGATKELIDDLTKICKEAGKTIDSGKSPFTAKKSGLKNLSSAELEKLVESEIVRLQEAIELSTPRQPEKTGSTDAEAPKAAPRVAALSQDAELVGDFVLEAKDHLMSIETQMLVLEQNSTDLPVIHSVFRAFHTIKGLAGFLEFEDIQCVAHEVETLLDLARNGTLSITPAIVDIVLGGADYLKEAIAGVDEALANQSPRTIADYDGLLEKIRAAMKGDPAAAQAQPEPVKPSVPAVQPEEVEKVESETISTPTQVEAAKPSAPAEAPVSAQKAEVEPAPAQKAVVPAEVKPSAPVENAGAAPKAETKAVKSQENFSVRVDTTKLDHLMDMVGEMVIAQSLIRHNRVLTSVQDARLQRDLSQLARITNEVQRTTMGMRMLPVGQLFQRTARLVRDLSRRAGKQVELETSGEDTEVDKTIAEELADPLMHMVRNAVDHGIEPPAEREAAGKNPTARVRLAAYHQGGQIVVEVRDDGRGLNRDKILKKAKQNGLVQENQQLTENEIHHLIFEPGFSTADQVTDISGRGVGMDVVRGSIQKLRGRIEIKTAPGEGTTFFIKLPLTLAIIEGLVVVVGDHRYIVPLFAVKEMFRPTQDMLSTVEVKNEMATVRGRLLPIVRLHRRFNIEPRSEELIDGLLVVAECQGKHFCLLVDDLVGKQEVVIKSLGEGLKNIPGIAGGAILGDGRVGLILDMDGVSPGATHD